jgi:hypothetical protein
MEEAVSSVPRKLRLPQGSRDALKPHPLAKIFPPMEPKEFKLLVTDIKKPHGLREAITLYEGKILDGVHRYRACLQAKVEPWAIDFEGDEAAAAAFVISKNAHRRHLKPAQKRKAIAALLKLYPEKSDRQIGEETGSSPTTVGKVRTKGEATGVVSKVDTRRDKRGRRQPARKPRPSNRATTKGRKSRPPALAVVGGTAVSSKPAVAEVGAANAGTTANPNDTAVAPTATDAAEPGTAATNVDLVQDSPWGLARTIVAKIDGLRARDIACAILDELTRKLNEQDRKPLGEFIEEANADQVARLQDENQRLEIKCLALESEVKNLKVQIQKLKAPSGNDADATASAEVRKNHFAAEEKAVAPTATAGSANSNISIDGWQVKFKQYPAGWFWSATNENVSLNSNPSVLFATPEEAEANARAAIARAQPAPIAEERRQ